jgi:hypothetical protein
MLKKPIIKCFNKDVHRRSNGEGRILAILGKDAIYIHCGDRACKRWTKIGLLFPGIKLDFAKAAIVQELMPEGYHFDVSKAAVVIGEGPNGSTS